MQTKLVAELGCAHLGSKNVAEDMVDACIEAGIDEVKGQVRWMNEKWRKKPRPTGYGEGGTFYDHQFAIELPVEQHLALKERLDRADKPYYVSVWDNEGARWAGKHFDIVKIAAPLHDRWELYSCARMHGNPKFYVSVPPTYDDDMAYADILDKMQKYPLGRIYSAVPMYPTPGDAAPLHHANLLANHIGFVVNCIDNVQVPIEWGVSLHVAYPHIMKAIVGAVALGQQAIEFHIAPYNEQRQTGARMGVPIRAMPELVQTVRYTEYLLGRNIDVQKSVLYLDKMRKTIDGLK